jgi:hypothetical protein
MPPLILDSVTHLTDAHRGAVAYAASHGGHYAAYYAATKGVAAIILNDAGIGRERVGIAGCGFLDTLGVPSATVASKSAMIGDGRDGPEHGILSHVNARAADCGLKLGMPCREALDILSRAKLAPAPTPPPEDEHRVEVSKAAQGDRKVILIDSASLVLPTDTRNVVITGSHGGLLGGKAATAIKYDVLASVYNDAGFGKNDAGISRLSALDARGIAAACVSHFSARIGDARSTYEDGFISAINATAERRGALVGQPCREFVIAMLRAG